MPPGKPRCGMRVKTSKRSAVPLMASAASLPAMPVSASPCPENPCRKYTFGASRPKSGARFSVISTSPPHAYSIFASASCGKTLSMRARVAAGASNCGRPGIVRAPAKEQPVIRGSAEVIHDPVRVDDACIVLDQLDRACFAERFRRDHVCRDGDDLLPQLRHERSEVDVAAENNMCFTRTSPVAVRTARCVHETGARLLEDLHAQSLSRGRPRAWPWVEGCRCPQFGSYIAERYRALGMMERTSSSGMYRALR